MTAWIQVGLKPTVLDPQGQAIHAALRKLGFGAVAGVRQAKVFQVEMAPGADPAEAKRQIERAAREVLANPVIEEFSIRWEE